MSRCLHITCVALMALASWAQAVPQARGDERADAPAKEKARQDPVLTVAIYDFESEAPGAPGLGKQVAEIIGIKLSHDEHFKIITRVELGKVVHEHELNKAGVGNQALADGKLLGAQLILTGKVFLLDGQDLFVTSKLISTVTGQERGEWVSDKNNNIKVLSLTLKLADLLLEEIKTWGPKLVGVAPIDDPLGDLKRALAGRKLPIVAVQIHEQHRAAGAPVQTDPAAETEVQKVLKEASTLIQGNNVALANAGVDVVISGEGFSEFAARIGNLLTCTAHLEIKIKDRKTGEVLFSDQVTTRAVDLAENTTAKAALQKAGHSLGLEILRHFDKTLPGGKGAK